MNEALLEKFQNIETAGGLRSEIEALCSRYGRIVQITEFGDAQSRLFFLVRMESPDDQQTVIDHCGAFRFGNAVCFSIDAKPQD